MEGTMGHLRWSCYPLFPLVWRFTIMGDLPSLFKKKKFGVFLDHNMNLHKMIEIYLKYDNMHIFAVINALICINKHVITCINSMLSGTWLHLIRQRLVLR